MRFTAGKFKGHHGAMMSCDPVWIPNAGMWSMGMWSQPGVWLRFFKNIIRANGLK